MSNKLIINGLHDSFFRVKQATDILEILLKKSSTFEDEIFIPLVITQYTLLSRPLLLLSIYERKVNQVNLTEKKTPRFFTRH